MLIGPHSKKLPTPDQNKEEAIRQKWDCFQTFWGSKLSLRIAKKTAFEGNTITDGPLWIFHCAYVAHVTHKGEIHQPMMDYLRLITQQAAMVGASYVVIHVGATKDQDPDNVIKAIRETTDQLQEHLVEIERVRNRKVMLLVENVAAKYPFNSDLKYLIEAVRGFPYIGYCLDLHHAFAAGIHHDALEQVLEDDPPMVVHANYPGAGFASGRDRHGWYYQGLNDFTDVLQREVWENLVKKIYARKIPIIMEGASTLGSLSLEVEAVRKLCDECVGSDERGGEQIIRRGDEVSIED